MYSGTTFHSKSGHVIGVHQRIDRLARRNMTAHLSASRHFPKIRQILHFEGNNGPDGIKRKSPSVDEPWHFIDPTDRRDTALLDMIDDHIHNLTEALRADEMERAAFEAAWLAHAVVDGLTPAHHYPLSDTIEKLWGAPKEERLTRLQKNLIFGDSKRDTFGKNWQYWGAKGVFSTHVLFELGVASSITTHRFKTAVPTDGQLKRLDKVGFRVMFIEAVDKIHQLGMYEEFWRRGWTTRLATETRRKLMPTIIVMVTLAWLAAMREVER